jgi:rSAM/selenodomain-associated transferase 2
VTESHYLLSIVVPTLNEAGLISVLIAESRSACGPDSEIVVVDGGSSDETVAIARQAMVHAVVAQRGRARQMNAGAAAASGNVLLFLHADTRLPAGADRLIADALKVGNSVWGRFDVRIEPSRGLLRVVAFMMNLRSRVSGIATGDQAIFVRRETFQHVGGFPDIPLMEDIALSKALRAISRPKCLYARVKTSSRRWQRHGVVRTMLMMWKLRWLYHWGADPEYLAQLYHASDSHD